MNARAGKPAEARRLIAVGTLSLIDLADEQGVLDRIAALKDLRQTTFRADQALLERFEARTKTRKI
jgi:predicted nucleic acid-binding protein